MFRNHRPIQKLRHDCRPAWDCSTLSLPTYDVLSNHDLDVSLIFLHSNSNHTFDTSFNSWTIILHIPTALSDELVLVWQEKIRQQGVFLKWRSLDRDKIPAKSVQIYHNQNFLGLCLPMADKNQQKRQWTPCGATRTAEGTEGRWVSDSYSEVAGDLADETHRTTKKTGSIRIGKKFGMYWYNV